MDKAQLNQLKSKEAEKIKSILIEFNTKHADLFNFGNFHDNGLWYQIWKAVFAILADTSLLTLHPLCLNTIRILTRDEVSLQTHKVADDLNCLLELAQLTSNKKRSTIVSEHNEAAAAAIVFEEPLAETNVEALKCLCNLVFQSIDCRRLCKNHITDALLQRIAAPSSNTFVELYEMKLLFLITALEPTARSRLQIDLNGITYMTEWLDEKLIDISHYNDEQMDVLVEMLKVMFNITTNSTETGPHDNEIQSLHLTGVIRQLLLRFEAMNTDRERNVVTHAINLLTNISGNCLTELVVKCDVPTVENSQVLYFKGYNVRVLDIFLRYLRAALKEQENAATSSELIPPVLTILVKCARCQAVMRQYIRSKVLPPLRDVSLRPELGNELRNHLCRFLTLPTMMVRDLAAELLFVCCKENVGRMIKYTGYGNAAGLFANRGVLDCRRIENTAYSSDSEDSDTEEYKKLQPSINPVLGCYEPPKCNPLEGMSEEQKEYEAIELVKLMDKLHKTGIVQPCRIGEDGKPQPVDHIFQLQDELPQQQLEQKRKT